MGHPSVSASVCSPLTTALKGFMTQITQVIYYHALYMLYVEAK